MLFRRTVSYLLCAGLTLQPLISSSKSQVKSYNSFELLNSTQDEEIQVLAKSLFSLKTPERKQPDARFGELLKAQTQYYADLAGRDAREQVFVAGDQASDELHSIYDNLKGITNLVGVANNPSDYHRDNERLIAELLSDLRAHPGKYDLTAAEAAQIEDLTDIPFEFLSDRIIFNTSLKVAGSWGTISATVAQTLNKALDKGRMWGLYILVSAGIEPVVASVFSEVVLQRIYVLHRLYSYMKGAKKIANQEARRWNAREAIQAFDAEGIRSEELFKSQIFRLWAAAGAFGLGIKYGLQRPHVEKMVAWSFSKKGQASKALSPLARLNNKLFTPIMKDPSLNQEHWEKLSKTYFTPRKHSRATRLLRVMNRRLKRVAKNFSANAGLTLADATLTSASLFGMMYGLLHHAVKPLLKTHLSPGDNIELALFSEADFNADYVRGTREFVYPMCFHLASVSDYVLGSDNLMDKKRKHLACKELIQNVEGIQSYEAFETAFPELLERFPTPEKGIPPVKLSKELLDASILKASKYPSEYRVTWLAMLRSIFGLDFVPQHYWMLQYRLLSDPEGGQDLGETVPTAAYQGLFTTAETGSAHLNIERLNYAIEHLAALQTMHSFNSYVEEGKIEAEAITDLTDKRIVEQTPNLVSAFTQYFHHRRLNVMDSQEKQVQMLRRAMQEKGISDESREDFGLALLEQESVIDLLLEEAAGRLQLSPEDRNWKSLTETEIQSLATEVFTPQLGP